MTLIRSEGFIAVVLYSCNDVIPKSYFDGHPKRQTRHPDQGNITALSSCGNRTEIKDSISWASLSEIGHERKGARLDYNLKIEDARHQNYCNDCGTRL